MTIKYDRDVEAVYIRLSDAPYAYGKDLDDSRRVDYDRDGRPVGIELLNVDLGVNLDDLPERSAVGKLLDEHHIKVFA